MALFGKLFEKKVCSICGGEIGLLGNRKLADGNCCKKCAAKLSSKFRKAMTVLSRFWQTAPTRMQTATSQNTNRIRNSSCCSV